MDSISKWAVAGSLAWLVLAVSMILGTHGATFGAGLEDATPATVLGTGCDNG